tara:strand:+ start:177 stop:950 length:774 start_codon:yes stop_codon:yes gene_type:complete
MRLTGTENVRIVGIPKNASQSIKRIGIDNPHIFNWDYDIPNAKRENHIHFTEQEFYKEDLTIIFPFRDEWERTKSNFLQYFRDHLELMGVFDSQNKEISYERVLYYVKTTFKRPELHLEKQPRNLIIKTELDNRLSYFNETVFNFFIDNIFNNDNWKGAKMIFVDLHTLRHQKFIDWLVELDNRFEGCTVPQYNVAKDHWQKNVIIKVFDQLRDEDEGKYLDYTKLSDWNTNVRVNLDNSSRIWRLIKSTNYYKNLK